MKRLAVSAVILLGLLSGACTKGSSTPSVPSGVQHVTIVPIKGEDRATRYPRYVYSGEYPRLTGMEDSRLQSRVNHAIEARVRQFIRKTSPSALGEIPRDGSDWIRFSLRFTCKVTLVNQYAVSMVFPYLFDTNVSAHSSSGFKTLSFKLSDGASFGTDDMFVPDSEVLRYLIKSEVSRQWSKKYKHQHVWEKEPTMAAFSKFALQSDGLTFYFDDCEVAGCPVGRFSAFVPYAEIRGMIVRDGPLGWAI